VSYQTPLLNRSRFNAQKFVLPTPDCQEAVLIVVNASFDFSNQDLLGLAEVQRPIVVADVPYGDPTHSSIRYESQLALEKPFVDVLVQGRVYAPGGRMAEEVQVGLRVGTLQKTLVASGDRFWKRGVLGLSPSSPRLFESMPLVYERAFGGARETDVFMQNPVGVGYKGIGAGDQAITTDVPNIEYPHDRVTSPSSTVAPGGFGVIARSWFPRVRYAGTYDDAWLKTRWPLLPTDFDPRHNQSTSADQQLPFLFGGEPVVLVNLSEEGLVRFALPEDRLSATFAYDRLRFTKDLRMDTVLIEPDEHVLTLTWRTHIVTRRTLGQLREIVVMPAVSAKETAGEVVVAEAQ